MVFLNGDCNVLNFMRLGTPLHSFPVLCQPNVEQFLAAVIYATTINISCVSLCILFCRTILHE